MYLKPNTELQGGKYRIIRLLGQGGFGITYLAEHTMLDKFVAIKEFFPKEYCDRDALTSHVTLGTQNSSELVMQLKTKFIKEAKNISKLHHANIITIHDIFQENDTAYYVMEYVEGASLSDMVKQQGAMAEDVAIRYITKIADAVCYMHSLSMNHLDLKPANIMVRKIDGEPILIDFGLSKQYDASGGQTSTTPVGISHGFAPIEQYRPGGVATFTPQTDVYALGATLFNLLTGSVPPHYSDILEDGLPALSSTISHETCMAIEHAMEVKKNKRPESMAAWLAEMKPKSAFTQQPTSPTPISIVNEQLVEVMDKIIAKSEPVENEGTIIIGTPISPAEKEVTNDGPTIINGVEFVDLGLSVKWASRNVGAIGPEVFGTFVLARIAESKKDIADWFCHGAQIPTIAQFEELRNNCRFELTESNGISGYKVIGKNGQFIFLPFSGDEDGFSLSLFGRLFTREAYNPVNALNYYFYFKPGEYMCQSYMRDYSCPVRLVLPK